jgi:hypothetical protein
MAVAPGGDLFVSGGFRSGGIDFGGGPSPNQGANDVFVARLKGTDGTPVWTKTFGGSDYDTSSGLAATVDGDVVFSGQFFQDTVSFGGPSHTSTYWDMFLVRLQGGSGDYVWSKSFGGGFNDLAGAVRVDSTGSILLAGSMDGPGDLGGGPLAGLGGKPFVAKYTPDGTYVSARVGTLPDAQSQAQGFGLALDSSDNAVFVGEFHSATVDLGGGTISNASGVGDDMFVAKYTPSSAHLFSAGYGGTGIDWFMSVAVFPPTGNIVAVGLFQQTVDMGDGPRASNGGYDAIIASLGPRP